MLHGIPAQYHIQQKIKQIHSVKTIVLQFICIMYVLFNIPTKLKPHVHVKYKIYIDYLDRNE